MITSKPHAEDTGIHYGSPPEQKIQPQEELDTIPEEEEPQMNEQPDSADQDTVVFTPN